MTCSRCNERPQRGSGPYCTSCKREYDREYYRKNRNKMNEQRKETRRLHREHKQEWLWEYMLSNPCVDCGEADPVVLQFDHLADKKYDVSNLLTSSYSLDTLQEEVQKCEVRCANCHQRKTAHDQGFWTTNMTR